MVVFADGRNGNVGESIQDMLVYMVDLSVEVEI